MTLTFGEKSPISSLTTSVSSTFPSQTLRLYSPVAAVGGRNRLKSPLDSSRRTSINQSDTTSTGALSIRHIYCVTRRKLDFLALTVLWSCHGSGSGPFCGLLSTLIIVLGEKGTVAAIE